MSQDKKPGQNYAAFLREMDRRKFLTGTAKMAGLGALAFGLAPFLAACGSTSSGGGSPQPGGTGTGGGGGAQSRELVIGFDGGTWQEFHDEVVTQNFIKQYPDVTVTYDIGTESDRMTKLIAQKNNMVVDASKFGTPTIAQAMAFGVTQEMDPSIVTNLADIHANFQNGHWAARIVATFGLVYNTEKIPEGISSWEELWDPKFKGRVGLPVFEWMGENFLQVTNKLAGGKENDVSKGIDALKDFLANDPVFINNTDHGMQLFSNGEMWAAPFWDGRAKQLIESGVPVKFVFPSEGALPLGYGLSYQSDSNVPELAQQYINMSLSPEMQIEYSRRTQYPPTNLKVLENLPSDLEAIAIPMEAMDNMMQIDYVTAGQNRDQYLDLWNKNIGAGA